jgi:hypothetical protein
MSTIRSTALLVAFIGVAAFCAAREGAAQQKYTISQAPNANSQYLQEHTVEVDDVPGHRLRAYEIRQEYPQKDLAFAGVIVKEGLSRNISDTINGNGSFTYYMVYRGLQLGRRQQSVLSWDWHHAGRCDSRVPVRNRGELCRWYGQVQGHARPGARRWRACTRGDLSERGVEGRVLDRGVRPRVCIARTDLHRIGGMQPKHGAGSPGGPAGSVSLKVRSREMRMTGVGRTLPPGLR